jgi:hypothetical protein
MGVSALIDHTEPRDLPEGGPRRPFDKLRVYDSLRSLRATLPVNGEACKAQTSSSGFYSIMIKEDHFLRVNHKDA